jgi:hypothetical protein
MAGSTMYFKMGKIGKIFTLLGACRNSFFGVFGIFLAKKSSPTSKFQRGNIFTWPTFSHFVIHSG